MRNSYDINDTKNNQNPSSPFKDEKMAREEYVMVGLSSHAYTGAPRGIPSHWPEAPVLLTRLHHWSFEPSNGERQRCIDDALALLQKVGR